MFITPENYVYLKKIFGLVRPGQPDKTGIGFHPWCGFLAQDTSKCQALSYENLESDSTLGVSL